VIRAELAPVSSSLCADGDVIVRIRLNEDDMEGGNFDALEEAIYEYSY
jgi:hypothetical protein